MGDRVALPDHSCHLFSGEVTGDCHGHDHLPSRFMTHWSSRALPYAFLISGAAQQESKRTQVGNRSAFEKTCGDYTGHRSNRMDWGGLGASCVAGSS